MAEAKKKHKKKTGINTKAKKKTSVARAVITKGSGRVKINKRSIDVVEPEYARKFMQEPLKIAGDAAGMVDITVNVHGGGFMSQAVAARAAIAKALVAFTRDQKLKEKMLAYDRLLLVDDVRRKEAKKPLGRGARQKRQTSKR
jgi:small subunit ribosomal protein S9